MSCVKSPGETIFDYYTKKVSFIKEGTGNKAKKVKPKRKKHKKRRRKKNKAEQKQKNEAAVNLFHR